MKFVRELVKRVLPSLKGIYDKESVVENMKMLNGSDDGNSLSNLLWWVYSRVMMMMKRYGDLSEWIKEQFLFLNKET